MAAQNGDCSSAISLAELAVLLPHYKFLGMLGEGGMGVVYLARQITLNRPVAIKVLPPEWGVNEDFALHFEFEAHAMGRLNHNGIVAVHDFGITAAGHVYLVMEYVEGKTLHRLIRERVLTQERVQELALQLCDAVAHAHDNDILHRDIKPGNILVDQSGRAKVMDFGLARSAAATVEVVSLGTPGYTAPELRQVGAVVDHRVDIYALGVVIHEMLTGSRLDSPRVPMSAFGVFDPAWEPIIDKATADDPSDRYSTIRELRDAIALVGWHQPDATTAASTEIASSETATLPKPRSTLLQWLPVVGSVLAVVGAFLWWQGDRGRATEINGSRGIADIQREANRDGATLQRSILPARPPLTAFKVPETVPAGATFEVELEAKDPEGAELSYEYQASTSTQDVLQYYVNTPVAIEVKSEGAKAFIKAPLEPGIYRLYGFARDQTEHSASRSRTIKVE